LLASLRRPLADVQLALQELAFAAGDLGEPPLELGFASREELLRSGEVGRREGVTLPPEPEARAGLRVMRCLVCVEPGSVALECVLPRSDVGGALAEGPLQLFELGQLLGANPLSLGREVPCKAEDVIPLELIGVPALGLPGILTHLQGI
jgi:hypothetical protein